MTIPVFAQRGAGRILEVTKTPITSFGDNGFVKSFSVRNMDVQILHDRQNNPRELIKTISYTGGDYKINTWDYDLNFKLDHFSSIYYNAAKTEVSRLDATYQNNQLSSAYTRLIRKDILVYSRLDLNDGGFKVQTAPPINQFAYEPNRSVGEILRSVQAKQFPYQQLKVGGNFDQRTPDDTYEGGSVKKSAHHGYDYDFHKEEYYDANNVLRKKIYWEYDEYGDIYEETYYYDCNGNKEHYTDEYYCGDCGETFGITEIDFENGEPVSGYSEYESEFTGDWVYEEYDPKTDRFVDPYAPLGKYLYKLDVKKYIADMVSCPPDKTERKSNFYIGPSLIVEKSGGDNLALYGGKFGYLYSFNPSIAVGIDLDYHTKGKKDEGKNTFIGAYLDGVYAPIKTADFNDRLTWTVKAFAGITNYNYKYSSYSNSSTNFTVGVGTGVELNCMSGKIIKGAGILPVWKLNFAEGDKFSQYGLSIQARF